MRAEDRIILAYLRGALTKLEAIRQLSELLAAQGVETPEGQAVTMIGRAFLEVSANPSDAPAPERVDPGQGGHTNVAKLTALSAAADAGARILPAEFYGPSGTPLPSIPATAPGGFAGGGGPVTTGAFADSGLPGTGTLDFLGESPEDLIGVPTQGGGFGDGQDVLPYYSGAGEVQGVGGGGDSGDGTGFGAAEAPFEIRDPRSIFLNFLYQRGLGQLSAVSRNFQKNRFSDVYSQSFLREDPSFSQFLQGSRLSPDDLGQALAGFNTDIDAFDLGTIDPLRPRFAQIGELLDNPNLAFNVGAQPFLSRVGPTLRRGLLSALGDYADRVRAQNPEQTLPFLRAAGRGFGDA